jgi:arylsulfatase A-like enzyme
MRRLVMDGEFPVRVDRNVYPRPEYRFPDVKIATTYQDSVADFPRPLRAPEGAPNILLVLLDDVGFGWSSALGGLVRMPTAERLAGAGLTYNQFHTTALCSPTRAALLTGRNHHSAHSGNIGELATGFPGYDGIIPKSCATIAELLHENGYATGWWGKNHNIPDNQTSEAGPFDNWPTQRGFDYFYGFIGGETDQFYPALYRGTRAVPVPDTPEHGYHLTRDLANDCIDWMGRQKAIAPDRPIFAYFSTGAAHAPHQPPLDWRGRNAGRFDLGWDAYREQTWRRQLELGVVPAGTQLTQRPAEIPAWEDHTDEQQRLMARQAENYADFLEHTDFEVGRLVDALAEMGELDNTLVIYIIGDNGSSAEGTLTGIVNEMQALNGYLPTFEQLLPRIDEIGRPGTSPHYAVGWAWAGDTPFQWTKQIASHFGGTRNGMFVSWPAHISDTGTLRAQFHHAIDILPTLLEVVGIAEPATVNGVPRGRSRASAWPPPSRPTRPRSPAGATPSTSRCSATGPCTTTAGSPAAATAACPGSASARPTSPRTAGSCTTSPTTTARPSTWPPSTPTSCASSRTCSWPRRPGTTSYPWTTASSSGPT